MGSTGPVLLLLLFLLSPAVPKKSTTAGPYSLSFFYTGLSKPQKGTPRFWAISYLNDQPFFRYNSLRSEAEPLGKWAGLKGLQNWSEESLLQQFREDYFMITLKDIMKFYKDPAGSHTFQGMFGCELRSNGSIGSFWKYGYDGKDFIEFRTDLTAWVALDPAAKVTKSQWEADVEYPQRARHYLLQECPGLLRNYLRRGRHLLDRKEPPAVFVTSNTDLKGNMIVKCGANGFYPRDIRLRWTKLKSRMELGSQGATLPTVNGTYLASVAMTVAPGDRTIYTCHLEHSSLGEPTSLIWSRPMWELSGRG
ncbi:zinc-alpha-2-glycoprotein isoform X1 [Erinaceus europaeus]|uniref:Zinc-alpha-2-glycoprotein isoform X1 n=1 Tax=Erinaceus europaeus TaxID=9365 RepID=A0A1S3WQZ7_ERIEU|nr:zinc-alpha-2-glycoprotein isoform X1 [Erinaceus europaeus]